MTDTIRAAKQHSPTNHLIFCNDNEGDLRGLAPLFIKQQIQLLSALGEAQKARRDQLRKVVGPPATALDLKEITQKYPVSAVVRDEVYVWSNAALGYLLERVLQSNMHNYQELDKEVEHLQGYRILVFRAASCSNLIFSSSLFRTSVRMILRRVF
jgi:hypothetical protein